MPAEIIVFKERESCREGYRTGALDTFPNRKFYLASYRSLLTCRRARSREGDIASIAAKLALKGISWAGVFHSPAL